MKGNYKFLVCGGDLRQLHLATALSNDGYITGIYGFDKITCNIPDNIKMVKINNLKDYDVVILPLPCSKDGKTVNMPFCNSELDLTTLLTNLNSSVYVFGGKLPEIIINSGLKTYDYLSREEMAVANAVPTAEGAVQLAMEHLPVTINGCSCLVLGYGRIGKYLCSLLKSMGADVSCEARKPSDLSWIEARGFKPVKLSELDDCLSQFRLIINTVPHKILDRASLCKVRKDAFIIDLASAPGGVDFAAAEELGIDAVLALSLPGKVAPVTAGIIIKNTVLNMLEEMGCKL